MKRTPLKAVGRRMKRRLKERKAFRQGVLRRTQGFCDRCGAHCGKALQAHHYRPRSLGGTDDPRLPECLRPILYSCGPIRRRMPFGLDQHTRPATCPDFAHPDGNGVGLCTNCHAAAHLRHENAAAWINSRNRSLKTH